MPLQLAYKIFINSQFQFQAICNKCVKFHKDLLIRITLKFSQKIDYFWFRWDFWDPYINVLSQNWFILQKIHKNQSCRLSKSNIIMWHQFLGLEGQKGCKWALNILNGFDCIQKLNLFPRSPWRGRKRQQVLSRKKPLKISCVGCPFSCRNLT